MNRVTRSRLTCLAVILTLSLVLTGCPPEVVCVASLLDCISCVLPSYPPDYPPEGAYALCAMACLAVQCQFPFPCEILTGDSAATWEQLQTAAIQYCETYPEECREALDSSLEAPDTEPEE